MNFDFSELETTGFIILKNVISLKEIEELRQEYLTTKLKSKFVFSKDTGLPVVDLKSIAESILKTINSNTSIKTDWIAPSGLYFNPTFVRLDWHQDHEIFYKTQDTFNNLNFWIPIIKTNIDKNGMRMISLKTLTEHIPEITEKYIIHKGAQRFKFQDNKTTIFNDNDGTQISLDEDILSLSKEISIGPRDILIFRGDVIHKTSYDSSLGTRVAIGFRAVYSNGIFSKSKFFNNCTFKKNQIENNPNNYHHITSKLSLEPDREFFKLNEFIWSTSYRGTPKHYGLKDSEA